MINPAAAAKLARNVVGQRGRLRNLSLASAEWQRMLARYVLSPCHPEDLHAALSAQLTLGTTHRVISSVAPCGLSAPYMELYERAMDVGKYPGWDQRGWRGSVQLLALTCGVHIATLDGLTWVAELGASWANEPSLLHIAELYGLGDNTLVMVNGIMGRVYYASRRRSTLAFVPWELIVGPTEYNVSAYERQGWHAANATASNVRDPVHPDLTQPLTTTDPLFPGFLERLACIARRRRSDRQD